MPSWLDLARRSFVQSYGSTELDTNLLRLPAVGFLPATDPRIAATVSAIRRELSVGDGLLLRAGDCGYSLSAFQVELVSLGIGHHDPSSWPGLPAVLDDPGAQ